MLTLYLMKDSQEGYHVDFVPDEGQSRRLSCWLGVPDEGQSKRLSC